MVREKLNVEIEYKDCSLRLEHPSETSKLIRLVREAVGRARFVRKFMHRLSDVMFVPDNVVLGEDLAYCISEFTSCDNIGLTVDDVLYSDVGLDDERVLVIVDVGSLYYYEAPGYMSVDEVVEDLLNIQNYANYVGADLVNVINYKRIDKPDWSKYKYRLTVVDNAGKVWLLDVETGERQVFKLGPILELGWP